MAIQKPKRERTDGRRDATRARRSARVLLVVLAAAGCAVHRYDPDTGVEHVWGFGHLAMRAAAPSEGVRAVVTGTELYGVGIGTGRESTSLSVGWDRRRRLTMVNEDTAVRLEWPHADFLSVRVGSEPPFTEDR